MATTRAKSVIREFRVCVTLISNLWSMSHNHEKILFSAKYLYVENVILAEGDHE